MIRREVCRTRWEDTTTGVLVNEAMALLVEAEDDNYVKLIFSLYQLAAP